MKKIRQIKNALCDWFINYIPEPVRKSAGGFKDKVLSLFKAYTPKQSEPFESLRWKHQENLETSIRGSDCTFVSVQLVYCQSHKVNFRRGDSCIDSSDWIKNKKSNHKSEKYGWQIFNTQQLLH